VVRAVEEDATGICERVCAGRSVPRGRYPGVGTQGSVPRGRYPGVGTQGSVPRGRYPGEWREARRRRLGTATATHRGSRVFALLVLFSEMAPVADRAGGRYPSGRRPMCWRKASHGHAAAWHDMDY